jgi:hypothetical protein
MFLFSATQFTWFVDPMHFSYVRFDFWYLTFVVFFAATARRRNSLEKLSGMREQTSRSPVLGTLAGEVS